jgi:mycobactin lysine-N-oxygenase
VSGAAGRGAEADLLIVGAGAKATAIAVKVHVLNSLGLGPISLKIVEASEPAASWTGRNGMTSGEEPLAIPPIKDVGFPYQSHQSFGDARGDEIDRAMMAFTWQRHMIERHQYVRWVNAGSPPIQHREYGRYLAWALQRATAGVELVHGRVTSVSLLVPATGDGGERWGIEVAGSDGEQRYVGRALALTGPGVHRPFPHDRRAEKRIFHCDSRRIELARIPIDETPDIAIVGGGESALSCVAFLRAFRPEARLTIYTPTLPLSRGESFLENRVFSDPDEVRWDTLDERTRRDFVKHCDRGVFDPQTLASIAYDEHCRFVTGRVVYVDASEHGRGLRVVCRTAGGGLQGLGGAAAGPGGEVVVEHGYVVNCTGFDLLEQLRGLFSPTLRAAIERRVGKVWDCPPGSEIPIGRNLELAGLFPRLYIPGLGALRQGPGFANLGCLGLLANRVLEPLCAAGREHAAARRNSIREVV